MVDEFGGINDFNTSDANSMFLRIISETGLFGIVFIILFIIQYYVLRGNDHSNQHLWLISNATLVIILLQLLRQGNYTFSGFMFYMWLYYFTKLEAKKYDASKLSSSFSPSDLQTK